MVHPPSQGRELHHHLTRRWLHFPVNIYALKEHAHPEAPSKRKLKQSALAEFGPPYSKHARNLSAL